MMVRKQNQKKRRRKQEFWGSKEYDMHSTRQKQGTMAQVRARTSENKGEDD